MKKQNKKSQLTFESHIKLHFVLITALFFLSIAGFTLYAILSQFNEDIYNSAWTVYLLTSVLLPITMVAISYFLAPSYTSKLEKAFWTVLVAFVAMLLYLSFQQFIIWVPFNALYEEDGGWIVAEAIRTGISLTPVIVYFLYLYWLRRKHLK